MAASLTRCGTGGPGAGHLGRRPGVGILEGQGIDAKIPESGGDQVDQVHIQHVPV